MHSFYKKAILSGALLFFGGCPSINQKIKFETQYRKDLSFKINSSSFKGIAVPNISDKYEIEINSPFKLDLLKIETCHRELSIEGAYYKKRILKNKKVYKFSFKPIEIEQDCIIEISALSKKNTHSFAFIALNSGFYNIEAKNFCNGNEINSLGVSACQSKEGLVQLIKFKEPVIVNSNCPMDKIGHNKFQYEIQKNHCVYLFTSKDMLKRRLHKLHTFGYEKIILRSI